MSDLLQGKNIILGVTGSIACYKAADLASKLRQAGADIEVILTKAAAEFVSPLTFQSVTGRRAYRDADLWGAEGHVLHIGLGKAADLMVIAPATANTMAKLAHGEAGNLLTLTALATTAPLLIAPAMDGGMWTHPATQANLEFLKARSAIVVGPEAGHLASGMQAVGRMTEPLDILEHIRLVFAGAGPLAKRKVIVTAGATQEDLDPVRYLTNRSSGKQGYALARAARDRGARVTFITTPTNLTPLIGVKQIEVRSAKQMLAAVLENSADADLLIMAAAVADFRPAQTAAHKIKKAGGAPQLELAANPDILKVVAEQRTEQHGPRRVVGFAAESQDLLQNAERKLKAKGLDMIAANDISVNDAGFAVDTNRVTLIFADGHQEELPLMSKTEVAEAILDKITAQL